MRMEIEIEIENIIQNRTKINFVIWKVFFIIAAQHSQCSITIKPF